MSSLADAVAPTRVRARHPGRRSRSRQSCHVRHLCRDPPDAGRHQPRNRRRAVGGVGRRRGTRLSILGSKTVASGYTCCRIGGGGIFRADALGSHGADGRRCGAWPCPALARIHLCAPPPRIHAHHYRHGAASFGRNRAGGLWSRWSRRCYRRFDAAVRMALCAFRTSRVLGDGGTLHGRIPRHLAAASGACVVRSSAPAAHVSSLSFAPIGGKRTTDIVTLLDCPFAFRRTRPCDDDIDIAANKFGYDARILLASRPGVTTSDRGTVRSVYRRTSLPRGGRQVLGANLNCSESRRALTAQPRIAYQMRQPLPKEPHSA